MIYITNANYRRFLMSLDLNIPNYAKKEFFAKYDLGILNSVRKRMGYQHIRYLVISDLLSKDKYNLKNRMCFYYPQKSDDNQKLRKPAYHTSKDCSALHSDYNDGIRTFVNTGVVDFSELKKMEDSIGVLVKELDRESDELDKKYADVLTENHIVNNRVELLKVFLEREDNLLHLLSSMEYAEAQHSTAQHSTAQHSTAQEYCFKLIGKIQEIDNNKEYDFNVKKQEINKLFEEIFSIIPYEYTSTFEELEKKLKEVVNLRKKLLGNVFNVHFLRMSQNDISFEEQIYVYAGFKKCSQCNVNNNRGNIYFSNMESYSKELCDEDDEDIPF